MEDWFPQWVPDGWDVTDKYHAAIGFYYDWREFFLDLDFNTFDFGINLNWDFPEEYEKWIDWL